MTEAAPVDGVLDPASTGSLVRSSAVVSGFTALSRLTGLLRVIALTYAVGATIVGDGYNLANTTPNMVYDLVIGGVLSATLVPVFVQRFDRDDTDGISAVITVATVCLVVMSVVAVIAAPWIIHLYTWQSTAADTEQLTRVGVPLLRLFLPQILFYGLTALGTSLLNARRRFAAAAFAPVMNNIIVIAMLIWFAKAAGTTPTVDDVVDHPLQLWILGAGTTAGIVAMAAVLWPAIRRAGIRLRWNLDWRNASVRTVASLSKWTFLYVVVNQLALVIALALANRQQGGPSAYIYAYAFFQLPYGLFAASIMTAFTPDLAASATDEDWPRFRDRFALGTRLITLILLPSSLALAVLARPLVEGLLGRGAFSGNGPELTADVLSCFAVGLLGFSLFLFAQRGFYALHDTRRPFFNTVLENAINVVLAFALVGQWGVQGVAFSYSIAYGIAAVTSYVALGRRVGGIGGRELASQLVRIGVAAAIATVALWAAARALGGDHGREALVRLAVGGLVGLVVYLAAAALLGVEDVRSLVARVRGRASRSAA